MHFAILCYSNNNNNNKIKINNNNKLSSKDPLDITVMCVQCRGAVKDYTHFSAHSQQSGLLESNTKVTLIKMVNVSIQNGPKRRHS